MALLCRQLVIPSLNRQGIVRFEKLFPGLHSRANEGFTHLREMHLLTISCFKLHSHMFFLTKEATQDIPVSFRLHTVTVNCHSSSCSHLFPEGKREDEQKGRVDALSFDNCT